MMLGSPKPSEPASLRGVVNPACAVPPPTAADGEADETSVSITANENVAATTFLTTRCLFTLRSSCLLSVLLGEVEAARTVDLERHVVRLRLRIGRCPLRM